MKRCVLFLCTGNSARSQMAEAMVNHSRGEQWQAFSAGTHPTGKVHPLALVALQVIGIDASSARSKSVDAFRDQAFNLVVTVAFFLYAVPKILLLLSAMIFGIPIIRTFFSAERTRRLLGGRRQGIGNVLAAMRGIGTPFCACSAWWSVPVAVLIGVPFYWNAAGMIPIVSALAFMMVVIGLSLPEAIILRRVLKPQLIAIFLGVVATAIALTGYLFNLII